MKGSTITIKIYALIFLVMGVTWLYAIYERGQTFIPREEMEQIKKDIPSLLSVRALKKEMKKTLDLSSGPNGSVAKSQVYLSLGITFLELICAVFYVFLGFALLRFYPFGRGLVIVTLLLDISLKMSILVYQNFLESSIWGGLGGKNIIALYINAGNNFFSKASGILTGLSFSNPQFFKIVLMYILYVFVTFYYFTRRNIIQLYQSE